MLRELGIIVEKKMAVEKTRNGQTWTEARYYSAIRSALRRGFRHWKPIQDCKLAARRSNQSENRRLKWEYNCRNCGGWFPDKDVQIDHIVPAGSLKSLDDIKGFVERLTVEDGFQCLCLDCHKIKTATEREARKECK